MRAVPEAVAQHVDGAALRDFALQPRQELAPRRTVLVQRQRFGGVRLGGLQECRELDPIDTELAVVVVGIAAAPARAAVAGAGPPLPCSLAVDRRDSRSAPCRSGVRGRVRWCRSSHRSLLGSGGEGVGGLFLAVDQGIRLVERLQFLDLVRESCRRLPHVELPGDHVGDQAGTVFTEEDRSRGWAAVEIASV